MRRTHNHCAMGRPSRTYRSWEAMMGRCLNQNHTNYPTYGARGITVCERWRSFEAFLEDMGERPEGKTIDRIDNSRGYEPGNCRWATSKEQHANRRLANLRKTHCKRGHPLSGDNVQVYRGNRRCVQCIAYNASRHSKGRKSRSVVGAVKNGSSYSVLLMCGHAISWPNKQNKALIPRKLHCTECARG